METSQKPAKSFLPRLRGRYVALAAGLAIVPLALIILVIHRDLQARFEKQQEEMLLESVSVIAANVTARFDLILGQLRTLAAMPPVPGLIRAEDAGGTDPADGSTTQMWTERYATLFRDFGTHDHRILSLRLMSPDGQVWVREDMRKGNPLSAEMRPVIESSDDPGFLNARRLPQGMAFVSQLLRPRSLEGGAAEQAFISFAMPVYFNGQSRAVLVTDMLAAQVFAQTAGQIRPEQFILADAQGRYIAGSEAGVPSRPTAASIFADWPGLDPRKLDITQHSKSMGSALIARLIDVNPKGTASFWMVAAVKNGDATASMLKEIKLIAVQWSIILGVLALSAALVMADLISKPLMALACAARRVRTGDLTVRAPVTRNDEIGDLARSFNAMMDSLQAKNKFLEEACERARAQTRAKSEFLAGISPEIRIPLNGVLGTLELLSQTELDARQRGFAGSAKNSAEALQTVLSNVLDLSEMEAGKLSIEHIAFDLRRLTEECTTSLSHHAQEKKLQLLSFVPAEIPAQVMGDPYRIRQVLMHLLRNAIEFTHRGEVSLALRARAEAGGRYVVRFDVKDTGIGMTEEQRSRLFAARAGASAVGPHDGLGLAVCRGLVGLMNGEIGADSKAGRGSLFWFEVPVRNADTSTAVVLPCNNLGRIPMSLTKPVGTEEF